MIRDDLSSKLVHLTRGDADQAAADAFVSIFQERKLRGSTRDIRGGDRCVCFSEAPISKLAHILATPAAHGMRYKPFGVLLDKDWLFTRGGRPAIYQTGEEYELLHPAQRYRHVRYEPGATDYTWEREWRLRADELELDPAATTLVVPNRSWERWALDKHTQMLGRRAMILQGFTGPRSVSEFAWHFLVLEDLGVQIPNLAAPPTS